MTNYESLQLMMVKLQKQIDIMNTYFEDSITRKQYRNLLSWYNLTKATQATIGKMMKGAFNG